MATNGMVGALFATLGLDTAQFQHGIDKAQTKAATFGASMAKIGGGLSKFGGDVSLVGGLVGAALVPGIISTVNEFERLGAVMQTTMGSTEAANKAFSELKSFAATTPYQLSEVVDGFNKLKAMGLDPSTASLTAFGNTASAMGKPLNQMIEAVADAATGEFERLKEFGIRSSKQGDQVAFTFQGVTKTVAMNSKEIQGYLTSLGNVNFAGAMDRQSQTLAGAWSNLQDATDSLKASIGAGLSPALQAIVKDLSGGAASGEAAAAALGVKLGAGLTSAWDAMKRLGDAISPVLKQVGNYLTPSIQILGGEFDKLASGPVGQATVALFKTLAPLVGGVLVGAVKLAVDGVTLFVSKINQIASAITGAINGVRNGAREFTDFGRNIADGVASGMRSGQGVVAQAAIGLANAAKARFTGPDGIGSNSPSKVFQKYGGFMADGLAAGVKGAIGKVVASVGKMALDAKAAYRAAAGGVDFIYFGERIAIDLARGIRGKSEKVKEAMQALADSTRGLFSEYATEQETATNKFSTDIRRADAALKAGQISAREYAELVERISKAYGNVVAFKLPDLPDLPQSTQPPLSSTDWIDRVRDGMATAANDNTAMRDAFTKNFGDGVRAAVDGDLGGFLKSKLASFASNMFDNAIDSLGNSLFDIFKSMGGSGSGGSGGIFSTIFKAGAALFTKSAPGFKTGGSFKVGGSGGADSKYVGMKVTPGEMVNISRPGNDNGGMSGQIILPISLGGEKIETIMVDIATRQASVITGTALQSVNTAQSRKKTYSRYG